MTFTNFENLCDNQCACGAWKGRSTGFFRSARKPIAELGFFEVREKEQCLAYFSKEKRRKLFSILEGFKTCYSNNAEISHSQPRAVVSRFRSLWMQSGGSVTPYP